MHLNLMLRIRIYHCKLSLHKEFENIITTLYIFYRFNTITIILKTTIMKGPSPRNIRFNWIRIIITIEMPKTRTLANIISHARENSKYTIYTLGHSIIRYTYIKYKFHVWWLPFSKCAILKLKPRWTKINIIIFNSSE